MWKCVCDICGKEMIPLDAIPFKICISAKQKNVKTFLTVSIFTKGYDNDEYQLFSGEVCRDCRKELINRIEANTLSIIEKMQADAKVLKG